MAKKPAPKSNKPKVMTSADHRKLAETHSAKARLHSAKADLEDAKNPPKKGTGHPRYY